MMPWFFYVIAKRRSIIAFWLQDSSKHFERPRTYPALSSCACNLPKYVEFSGRSSSCACRLKLITGDCSNTVLKQASRLSSKQSCRSCVVTTMLSNVPPPPAPPPLLVELVVSVVGSMLTSQFTHTVTRLIRARRAHYAIRLAGATRRLRVACLRLRDPT